MGIALALIVSVIPGMTLGPWTRGDFDSDAGAKESDFLRLGRDGSANCRRTDKPSASSACVIVRMMQSLKLSFARPGFRDAYNNVNARGLAKFLLAVRFVAKHRPCLSPLMMDLK